MGAPEGVDSGPDVRPLGYIAFGFSALAALMAPTFFLTVWGVVAAVPGVALGLVCMREPEVSDLGRVAVVLGVLAVLAAAVALLVYW